MRIDANTPQEYLDKVDDDRRADLSEVRQAILDKFPEIKEELDYGMLVYKIDDEMVFALAQQKHYNAFYVMHTDLLDPYRESIKPFRAGKSCVRFKSLRPELREAIWGVLDSYE